MSQDYLDEALRDAKVLAERISREDYENLKKYRQSRSYTMIAFMLRRYGVEFKGLTYLETLVDELIGIKEPEGQS